MTPRWCAECHHLASLFICGIWIIHMWRGSFICDMTRLYVTWLVYMWHDAFVFDMTHLYVTWLVHVWHDSFIGYHDEMRNATRHYHTLQIICGPWIIRMWQDSFICDMTRSCVTWLVLKIQRWGAECHPTSLYIANYMWNMTHSYVTWFIHMWPHSFLCDMTHSYVTWFIHMWHDSFICDMTHSYATWPIHKVPRWGAECHPTSLHTANYMRYILCPARLDLTRSCTPALVRHTGKHSQKSAQQSFYSVNLEASGLWRSSTGCSVLQCVAVCCSVLQCVAVCCSVSQCVAVCFSVLQCVAVCCSVLQCVAVCCSVLQCVAACFRAV